ncbi:hypothetical protein, partial [Amycolatopsis pretoriensis]|uniref:hypothetical protein n=1 Tax=Amycolatopsis pretoriensis TaxID=218821 RepID=UPI001ABEE89C
MLNRFTSHSCRFCTHHTRISRRQPVAPRTIPLHTRVPGIHRHARSRLVHLTNRGQSPLTISTDKLRNQTTGQHPRITGIPTLKKIPGQQHRQIVAQRTVIQDRLTDRQQHHTSQRMNPKPLARTLSTRITHPRRATTNTLNRSAIRARTPT